MMHDTLAETVLVAIATGVGGFVLGLGYFAVLRRTVGLFLSGQGRLGPAILTIGRIAVAAAILVLVARLGALPLIGAFLGFLLARSVSVRRARRVE